MNQNSLFAIVALVLQVIFIVALGIFGKYGKNADPKYDTNATEEQMKHVNSLGRMYPMFQDVQGMIFLGFGFLMTFLHKYSFSSVGLNLFISALTIQWAIIINSVRHLYGGKIAVDVDAMISAEFTCAAVLISFGAILGKVTPIQLLIMAMVEVPVFILNEWIGRDIIKAADMGDSIFVHCFGAYFGIMCSRAIYNKYMGSSPNEGSSYNSDLFAMIGTLVLWIFWPSFNAAGAVGDDRHRAVINTFCGLLACTVVSFSISSLVGQGKFNMVHVQNATLAGGVAVGASADMALEPWGALTIGAVAGILSVMGYHFITPRLNKIGFHDTCGVNNLHGMPAILAGIASAVAAGLATEKRYGMGLYQVFPERVPKQDTDFVYRVTEGEVVIKAGEGGGRTALMQGLMQLAALGLTLVICSVGGAITGAIMRIPLLQGRSEDLFDDSNNWVLEEEEEEGHEHHHPKVEDESVAMKPLLNQC